ncbi:uncharacterized protein [Diadema antillarum]|uniref:uncharacterized protein isoform X3 n=2 Tax=Diadema antillarum TaxID=105358 RepID=UPI003A86579C
MHGPYQLTGIRVKVYRLGSTTQWFTAVITGHDLLTRELVVMDDTVLESHTENPAHIQMLFLDDVVNSLLKGENVGITRRNNRNTSNPAVTTQASSTTHTRPIPRSHSPSHAPTSQQTIVSNKKKRSKDKDVTPAPTPPAAEQPEKADKTLDKAGKDKTATSCSVQKSKKDRKRKSGDQVEEEKKPSSPTPLKRPRSNSGSSESSQDRSESTKEATVPELPAGEAAVKNNRVSLPEKDWQVESTTSAPVDSPKSRDSGDLSNNSSKTSKNKALHKQEQAVSVETKDSRSATPDSVKKSKQKSKKEHKERAKQLESGDSVPQRPHSGGDLNKVSTPTGTSVLQPMVESKSDSAGPTSSRPSVPEKESIRKVVPEHFAERSRQSVSCEQSLTSAIAGIIARELSKDLPTASQVSRHSELSSSVPQKLPPSREPQTTSVSQPVSNISSVFQTSSSDTCRPLSSGPPSTYVSSSSLPNALPHRTIAVSNSVPVISHGNGVMIGPSGMDKNVPQLSSNEITKLATTSAPNLSSRLVEDRAVLGERIQRPEARDISRETSSVASSDRSESVKSVSQEKVKDSDQDKTGKSNLVTDLKTPVQVYRDPNLSDTEVTHVDSIQHHHARLLNIADPHTPSPGHQPITPSPHSLRTPGVTANPSAIVASPSAFVPAPSVGHIPAHHPITHHAMFPAHISMFQQPLPSLGNHFPHSLAGLDQHTLQHHQLHAQRLVGLVQPDALAARMPMGSFHGIMSPQHAATALQGTLHPGMTQAQLQALQQRHPGLPLPPSWVLQHEEFERAQIHQREQQQKSQVAAAAVAAEKGQSALTHHPPPSSQQDLKARLESSSGDRKPNSSPAMHPREAHTPHHVHAQMVAVSQSMLAAAQESSAREAAAAAHHVAAARRQYQELDAQAAVQQHFQESLRKLQVPFSFTTPTTGGSITEGTALPKNKGQAPKDILERQHKDRQDHEERLRREREEKELEWQRIQREKERKQQQETDPRLRFPGAESEGLYNHQVSEGKHPHDDPAYRHALGHSGLLRYQEELAAKYHHHQLERKHDPKIKLERTEIGSRTPESRGFKAYQPSIRSDTHTTYYNTTSLKSEEPRPGIPVRTEQSRQVASASYKVKPENLVGYQPFLHTISSHGVEKGEVYNKHSEEYKMAANNAAKQGARRAIPTPPPLIKREPEKSEVSPHASVIHASRSERRPEMMHHPQMGVFTAASSAHDIHISPAGKHIALSDMRTNSDASHPVPVIKHTIGTPPPLHSSAQTTTSHLARSSHVPPQSPLKVATPQQLSAAVLQIGPHSASSTTTSTPGMYPHHLYSNAPTSTATTSSSSLLMSALRPQDGSHASELMEVDSVAAKRKPSNMIAMVHKKRPKTKEDLHVEGGNSDKKESTGMSYIEQYNALVLEPNAHSSGSATVGKVGENIELKIEKVDQYKRLSLDSSAPAALMTAEAHRTTNGTLSDSDSNRCVSPRSTASDSSDGRSLKSASPHRAVGPVYLKKAWLARHSESKAPPFGGHSSGGAAGQLMERQEAGQLTKLSNSLPNGHLPSGTFAQVAQNTDADKSVTIDDIPKNIPDHVYDFDHDKSSTCSEASTTSSHKSRSRKNGKESSRSSKKKDRKRYGSPADSKRHCKEKAGDKSEEKPSEGEKPKSEYLLGLETCRLLSNVRGEGESKSTQQIAELLNMIAQAPKKRVMTRASKDKDKDGQLNVSKALVKPTVAKLKKSGEAFLQDGMCCDITPNLMKCRECRIKPSAKQSKLNIFCRFYAFRRLKYSNKGNLTIAGFSEPEHCDTEDLCPWLPYPPDPDSKLDLETCLYIIARVGPQFCQLVRQEQEAKTWSNSPGKIAWKRAVTGVREMCDTCDTTLFNIHWTCSKCGFVVCLDCYSSKNSEEKNGESNLEAGAKWLKCIKDQIHQPDGLMLTQIIPGNALWDVGALVHQVCTKWKIPSACPCLGEHPNSVEHPIVNGTSPTSSSRMSPDGKKEDILSSTALSGHLVNARLNRPKLTSLPTSTSALDFLADVATAQDDKRGSMEGKKSDATSKSDKACSVDGDVTNAKGEPCSTLRDLLTKTAGKLVKPSNMDGSLLNAFLPSMGCNSRRTSRTMTSTFEDIIATVVEQNIAAPGKDRSGVKTPRLSTSLECDSPNSVKKARVAPNRNTLVESSVLYPDVPHSWLCDGRLLRLHDPSHTGNFRIFQEHWSKGEPVLVSNVHKQLDKTLWHPTNFNARFGHLENDLVDCRSGDVITGAPMRDFWNGFENISNRLETKQGLPIILKLKDWPPAEDFSELLPQHFQDLMNNLPLPDYTRRDGKLNLSSRLPDFFVKPDLGPKMYNAYGLARYQSCGTTNLHLDISDAVNVMVYVGMPKSEDSNETCDQYEREALEAVEHMCQDEQTKKRVQEKGERPGAIWHLFRAADTNKIRQFLIKLSKEQGEEVPADHDPIHDQSWYLDNALLDRLYKEYGVQGWAIAQCWGDAIFIPAGAPHQVRNVHSSIKVAEDFVSPEHISECFWLTQEFRQLSATHSNHEDKLQVKNIIYHAIKDTIGLLMTKPPPGSSSSAPSAPQANPNALLAAKDSQGAGSKGGGGPPQQQPSSVQPPLPSKPSPASTPPVAGSNTCSSS